MQTFQSAFDASLEQAELEMGEPFFVADVQYKAIEIEQLSDAVRAAAGGPYTDATMSMTVRSEVVATSGLKRGSIFTARGAKLRVNTVQTEGDASTTFLCGSVGVEIPRLR